ncbi:hypothetical protein LXL04_027798 [Taraxacum kok-saghyz]
MLSQSLLSILKKFQPLPSTSFHFNHHLDSCSSLSQLKQVHALILTNGSHKSLPVSTKLVNKAVSLSPTMDYARQVFDAMPHRDVFLWNTLIRGYSHLGPCKEAILTYRNMHRSGLSPDNFTFTSVIRSCTVLSALREGKQAHCNVIKNGFDIDVYIQSSLVTMYAQNDEQSDSEQAFDDIVTRNVVTWTAMIAANVQNGYLIKGLKTFIEMVNSGTKPNVITLVSVLPSCASLQFLNMGMLVHGLGVKLGVDSYISLTNSLIALYGKCGNITISRALFDQMETRTLVSWNAMIATYEQNNHNESAIKLFHKMQEKNINFDGITMVSVISACGGLGALDTGKQVHKLVTKNGLNSNIAVTNALIDMYSKCGSIDLASNVFNTSDHRTVVLWTSIISAYASHGHACRHSGLIEEGKKYFKSMSEDYFVIPGIEHCTSMVDLLGKNGKLLEAYEFIQNMPIDPDVDVWSALLSACRIHGNLELAEIVADRIYKIDPRSYAIYVMMINMYADAGRWEDVTRLRMFLDEMEVKRICGHTFLADL